MANKTQSWYDTATSVFYLSGLTANTYRECLNTINNDPVLLTEFVELFNDTPKNVIQLLDTVMLDEVGLDKIVTNSKPKLSDNLFA